MPSPFVQILPINCLRAITSFPCRFFEKRSGTRYDPANQHTYFVCKMTTDKSNGTAVVAGFDRGNYGLGPSEMIPLFDPKNLELLTQYGGPEGICEALKVNPKTGLFSTTHAVRFTLQLLTIDSLLVKTCKP